MIKQLFEWGLGHTLIKAVLIAVVVIVGVSGGIYIGYAFIVPDKQAAVTIDKSGDYTTFAETGMTLGIGDLFPLVNYRNQDGTLGNFEQLLHDTKCIIIFASLGCEPCQQFLELWNESVSEKLHRDVKVIVCLPNKRLEFDEEYSDLVTNKTVVGIDSDYFLKNYNVNMFPTVVGIDEFGLITHIQYSYSGYIDRGIVSEYTDFELD